MGISDNEWEGLAQKSHVLFGAILPITIVFLSGRLRPLWYLVPVFVAWAAWKEFWYDNKYENSDERGSDLLDFSMYMLGLFVGVGICFVKVRYVS